MWPSPLPRNGTACARAAAAILAAAILAAGAAGAQTFVGVGLGGRPVPPPRAPVSNAIPDASPAAPSEAVPAAAQTVLRFLPGTLDGLRLTGEFGDLSWPVYLTPAQAAAPLRLRVGYLSAVSVLPDASLMEVRVNGRTLGTDAIDAAGGLRTVSFEVPAGAMSPGYNAVSLTVQQRHRVDCSVAATYELWSRIEPSATGIELPAALATITDIADMPAVLPNADGSVPLHVVLAGKTNPAHVARLIRATQAVALHGRFLQPVVSFTGGTPDAFGLDLALGTRAVLGALPRFAGQLGTAGPLVRLLPAPPGGRPTLLVAGTDDGEVDAALDSLDTAPPATGTPAGRLAAINYPARRTGDNGVLPLRAFGIASQEFTGRFFRKSLNVELPADFLPSDYGRGTFDLAGGYAAGLGRGAQVRVDVNGRSSGIIKLPYAEGDVFRHNQLFVPLGLMRPGFNRIDIYAEIPRPEDASCAAGEAKRFLVSDRTELRFPALAHVERFPELAATTGGALPFTRGTAHLVVPRPDRDTMAAALSLTTRVAVAAGRVLPFTFATRPGDGDDGSTLIVSAARALDPAIMRRVGLDPAAVEKAWAGVEAVPVEGAGTPARWWQSNTESPAACRLPPRRAAASPAAPAAVPIAAPAASPDDFIDTWGADAAGTGWRDRMAAAGRRVADWVDALRQAVAPAGAGTGEGVTVEASLILAQGVTGADGNVTTIATAANAAALRASVGCLFDPQVWSRIHGRLAALDASNGAVTATDATAFHYKASGESSLGNLRLVLAGWFSLNPLAFVGLALLTAACLSGTTFMFVRGVGRRSE